MLSVSDAFVVYLGEKAPSLFYQAPSDCLSFRWKIPQEECLTGWTSPKSGIDIMTELGTDEICGFVGVHFPSLQLLECLANDHPGPYGVMLVVKGLQRYLADRGQTLGEHYARILHEADDAADLGCILQYATDQMKEPAILTRTEILAFSGSRSKRLPRA